MGDASERLPTGQKGGVDLTRLGKRMLGEEVGKLPHISDDERGERGAEMAGGIGQLGRFRVLGRVAMLGMAFLAGALDCFGNAMMMMVEGARPGIHQEFEKHMGVRIGCATAIGHRCAKQREAAKNEQNRMLQQAQHGYPVLARVLAMRRHCTGAVISYPTRSMVVVAWQTSR